MIYKLVCASCDSFSNLYKKDENEIIIAVDGGYDILKKNNLKVNYFFGDKDSFKDNEILSECIYEYNPIKDESDFDLVINYLINELKISHDECIYVYNATGGRLDHYQAIINTIVKNNDYKIIIFDECNCIFVSDYKMSIPKNDYKYISFFSLNDDTMISLSGMKYNIENYNLKLKDNLCLSNEILDEANISVTNKVLVFLSK